MLMESVVQGCSLVWASLPHSLNLKHCISYVPTWNVWTEQVADVACVLANGFLYENGSLVVVINPQDQATLIRMDASHGLQHKHTLYLGVRCSFFALDDWVEEVSILSPSLACCWYLFMPPYLMCDLWLYLKCACCFLWCLCATYKPGTYQLTSERMGGMLREN